MYDPNELLALEPSQLEQRRRGIIERISRLPGSYGDATTEDLQELSFIAGMLRRKTAGPPKEAKRSKRVAAPTATMDDLASLLGGST